MALVDSRQFNLQPQAQSLTAGLQELAGFQQLGQQNIARGKEEQIRQLLGQTMQQQPQTPQQQMLAAQTAEFAGEQAMGEQPQAAFSQEELIIQARQIDPAIANQQLKAMGLDDPTKRAEASRAATQIQSLPFEQRAQAITARAQKLQAEGRDPKDTLELLDMSEAQQNQALTGVQLLDLSTKERLAITDRATRLAEIPAGQREFEALIKDLSPEEKEKARLVKLGIAPRAVGSAIQTISEEGIADEIGKSSAIIKQREKFGEMTGASRAKSIDKGFEQIVRINQGINTIDRAISALEGGAKTGALQRFLPSMRAASVELENIRNQFALDVIGGVTLGAISESELALAKQVGLPEGLDEPELIEHLKQRRAAQEKLRAYYQEQVTHLDQGGTVASFLRMKERDQGQETTTEAAQVETPQGVVAAEETTTQQIPQTGGVKFLGFE